MAEDQLTLISPDLPENHVYDRRLMRRRLERGIIDRDKVRDRLDALPDLAEQIEIVDIELPLHKREDKKEAAAEAEATQEGEAAEEPAEPAAPESE